MPYSVKVVKFGLMPNVTKCLMEFICMFRKTRIFIGFAITAILQRVQGKFLRKWMTCGNK
jgi:hypothetical protein